MFLPGSAPQANFQQAADYVIDVLEGGAQLVEDSGGRTKYGISQRAFPDLDIAALTREAAVALYRERYWAPVRGDELPPALALVVFDAAVNLGPQTAVKLLQRVLSVPDDGIMGPRTLRAIEGVESDSELVARYLEIRARWYQELVAKRPGYTQYLHGWRLRCFRVAVEAGRLA